MKAGIVLVNKYCDTNDSRYAGYINYIDRDNAVRNDNIEKYNLYQNYMDNPEKSTGIFTDTKDFLTYEEKQNIKEVIKKAQEKGSLMWQPVISFDNTWLEENGLYDHNTGLLDEVKIREFTRKSIGKMLHKENLDHAIWTASIHYNTDNIHIHAAIVEPVPMREKRSYTVYDYVPDTNGNYVKSIYGSYVKATEKNQRYYAENKIKYKRIEKVDAKGTPIKREGYVGPFKQSSLELCKSTFANEILRDREYGIKINSLIRDSIVKRKRSMELEKDPELKERFLALHEKMPRKGNRGLWKYNSNIMLPLRTEIDQLTDLYIQKYHSEDFEALMGLIEKRSDQYKKAYGDTDRNYKNKKIEDLHTRMGNAILEEIRKYDQSVAENLAKDENIKPIDDEKNINNKIGELLNPELQSYNPELAEYYLNQSAEKGNEYAQLKLGIEYLKGTKIERNAEMGHIWLQKAADQDNEIAKRIITNMKNYEVHCRRGKTVNGLAKEIRRTNMRNMQRLDKAVAALKKSMNREYIRASRQNQLEHDEMIEKNRYQ